MATTIPWSNNFNRTYKITIGVREYTKVHIPTSIVSPEFAAKSVNESVIPSDAVTMDNLTDPRGFSFRFESQQVASSSGASSENTNLILYNISDEVKRILTLPNCIVIIEAGYEGKLTLCYTGDVVSITPQRNTPDIAYRIQLAAEGNAIRNTMISTHYDESISEQDIIIDMAGRFSGMSLATYGLSEYSDRYKTGGTGFTGSLVTNFDQYLKKKGLEYTITNNKMYIIPFRIRGEDYDAFARTNYTLSESNIKNIVETSDKTRKSNDEVQNKIKKVQVNTFYIPVEIGQFITIPEEETLKPNQGTYIVKGRRVILESTGNAWDVVLEAEELSQ